MGSYGAPIFYTVKVSTEHPRHFHVLIEVRDVRVGHVDFAMPVWTPGSYTVLDFMGRVHSVASRDTAGRELALEKLDKSTWRVHTGGSSQKPGARKLEKGPGRTGLTGVTKEGSVGAALLGDTVGRRGKRGENGIILDYYVRAHDVSVDRSFVDNERATINGASVYMYVVGRKEEALQVRFVRPDSWPIETGLTRVGRRRDLYWASDYDELLDSPVFMGQFDVETFKVRDVEHRCVIVGHGNFDKDQLVRDTGRIVETTVDMFRDVPYSCYLFFMEMAPTYDGGLEHRNSTHMIFDRWGFEPRNEYVQALLLISHEFFHTWNVKRLQPAELGPFDYSREVHSPLLWFSEGFTSYYEALILRRAGCISTAEYLGELGRTIRRLMLTPGRSIMTLEQSSVDAWTKFYNPHPDSPNNSISYYNKGSIFGWILDLEIRRRTKNRSSLDDVLRSMYKTFHLDEQRGFTTEDVEDAAVAVGGRSIRHLFDKIVRSKVEVDYEEYLGYAGLTIATPRDLEKGARKSSRRSFPRSYLGIRVKTLGGKLYIQQVLSSGPCSEANVHPGDELIAFDYIRLDEARLASLLGLTRPGHEVELVLARGGVMKSARVRLVERPPIDLVLVPRSRTSSQQKALYESWLGESLDRLDQARPPVDFRLREKIF